MHHPNVAIQVVDLAAVAPARVPLPGSSGFECSMLDCEVAEYVPLLVRAAVGNWDVAFCALHL